MDISRFLSAWGLWFLGGSVVLCIIFLLLMRFSPKFHYGIDAFLLRLPLAGSLVRNYNLANSLRTLSLLLRSDVGVISSLELVAGSTRNRVYRKAYLETAQHLTWGKTISEQMRNSPHLFPPLVSQMVLVGESTGNLSSSLSFLSHMHEEEVNELTKNLTTLLEPVLMILMGLIVGFIAISIITPIYSITQNLNPE